MKRLANIASWIGIAAWFILIMGFVSARSEQELCTHIEVELADSLHNGFVSPTQIRRLALNSGQSLQGYPLEEINTRELEHMLETNAYVRNAEVSTDITGELHIAVTQRKALIRIMPRGQGGYYLDTEGTMLPLSDHYTPHILLASGYLPAASEEAASSKQLIDLYAFASFIHSDEFWSNQIVQIYVDSKGEYELIPRVGAHQILFGSMDNWKKKLDKLALLYEQGLSAHGWNTYRTINLKYSNQVICTKR